MDLLEGPHLICINYLDPELIIPSRKLSPTLLPLLDLLHPLRNLHPPSAPRPPPHTILLLSICLSDPLPILCPYATASQFGPHRATVAGIPRTPRHPPTGVPEVDGYTAENHHFVDRFCNPDDHVRERHAVRRLGLSEGPGAELGRLGVDSRLFRRVG